MSKKCNMKLIRFCIGLYLLFLTFISRLWVLTFTVKKYRIMAQLTAFDNLQQLTDKLQFLFIYQSNQLNIYKTWIILWKIIVLDAVICQKKTSLVDINNFIARHAHPTLVLMKSPFATADQTAGDDDCQQCKHK